MADVTILVCACGMRLRAAGAVPGRVGKCPACGGLLRVPDAKAIAIPAPPSVGADPNPDPDPEATAGAYGLAAASTSRPSSYSPTRVRSPREPSTASSKSRWNGLIRVPPHPETRLRESLLYPLWGETGIALLILMPPVFWLATIPLLTIVLAWGAGSVSGPLGTMLALLPSGLVLLPLGSFTLLFLGRVVTTSAVGEVHHPRWPDWDPVEMLHGIGRWIWAILVGGLLGGFPSVAYWLYCGDVDLFDAIILVELAAVGAIYGQVALLASILYDDPLGAHPGTVVRAIWRVGWAWVFPSIVIATFLTVAWYALTVLLEVQSPWLSALAYWGYWVFLCYGAMVVLRVLGLFYHRHARVLGWFRERPRWGG
ncbi:hypothetical protein SAMN05444166_5797 [Singulisphaera sp. GP187]|uniref:hypothetical protein n=1 Tax=Singulisphaera sp. GP187 TaxID=1882752 RepID=UPI00092A55F8|nr:hypothetical protein [Singulisphaera sp. GP187]SIO58750.1 hypothetical protein SAMN05444166_5797 [Singulisphaera sp. GP187]